MTERSLFLALLEMDNPAQRSAWLDQACAGNPELRSRVEQLFAAYSVRGKFMGRAAADLLNIAVDEPPESEGPGTCIGPYRLLEQIGEGGFGVVFVAEQQRPVRRQVAVKVLKAGMETRQVVARFEAERQALALMDHPHIAHVLDGGETTSGRPFFVMELVRGIPISEFCSRHRLGLVERLKLFLDVCGAVHHAHQKGIIHRDLKPSNLLVTMPDTNPVVKVIDFGIAKALGHQLTDKTLFTNLAQLIGTPAYMSPEQAQMGALDIDTRADVYSLGVVLYELLTGTTPFDCERLDRLSYDEFRQIIREEEPPRPSTRISALGRAAVAVSFERRANGGRLSVSCQSELDWIVMKSLEKERTRRYDSVAAFADDVERYLRDEPVAACPPSRWYRLRKLARRNKPAFITATALTAIVLLAVAGLAVSNFRISREQVRTHDEKVRADRAQSLAEERASALQQELEHLKSANDLLERARWYASNLRFDDAHRALTKAAGLRPDHAAVWVALSELHTGFGLWDAAADDFARELKLREPESTPRWYQHALLCITRDDEEGYRRVRRKMMAKFRGTADHGFLIELVRTCGLGRDRSPEIESCVRIVEQLLPSHSQEWFYLYIAGIIYFRAGQYDSAALRLNESLAAAPEFPPRALAYPLLAMAYHRTGQPDDARRALADAEAALERWTAEIYGAGDDRNWVHHLGAATIWPVPWWDWLECRAFYREARLLIEGTPPPRDPRLHVFRARAFAGLRQNMPADAEYTLAVKDFGDDPQVRLEAHRNRGYLHAAFGRWSESATEFARARELQPGEIQLWFFEAVAHAAAQDHAAHRQACVDMLAQFETSDDPMAMCFTVRACVVSDGLSGGDDAAPSRPWLRLMEIAHRASPHGRFGAYVNGAALYRDGQYEEALRCFEALAEIYRPRAWEWCFLAMAHLRVGNDREARRCLAEAVRWIDEADHHDLDDIAGTAPAWGEWAERAEFPLLLSEARSLIEAPASGRP